MRRGGFMMLTFEKVLEIFADYLALDGGLR